MLRKILIIAGAFFILALTIAGYVLFIRNNVPTTAVETPVDSIEYFPFGRASGNGQSTTSPLLEGQLPTISLAKVTELSAEPISGAATLGRGSTTLVRMSERATGHITEVNLTTGTTSIISNTTIPKIYETLWLEGASSVIYRYLTDTQSIRTYLAMFQKPTATSTVRGIKGIFLPANISSIAASPSLKRIFYIEPMSEGIRGVTINADGGKRTEIFNSPMTEWIAEWPTESMITLTSKASSQAPGYVYSLNPTNGALRRILGNVTGLTTLTDSTGTYIAYSDNANAVRIQNIQTGDIITTGLRTPIEKCIWSKKQKGTLFCSVPNASTGLNYPEAWYQGQIQFTDSVYSYSVKTNNPVLVVDLQKDFNADIDGVNPVLSPNEDFLILGNKKDFSLWGVKLK
jgi:hypothetical protein